MDSGHKFDIVKKYMNQIINSEESIEEVNSLMEKYTYYSKYDKRSYISVNIKLTDIYVYNIKNIIRDDEYTIFKEKLKDDIYLTETEWLNDMYNVYIEDCQNELVNMLIDIYKMLDEDNIYYTRRSKDHITLYRCDVLVSKIESIEIIIDELRKLYDYSIASSDYDKIKKFTERMSDETICLDETYLNIIAAIEFTVCYIKKMPINWKEFLKKRLIDIVYET